MTWIIATSLIASPSVECAKKYADELDTSFAQSLVQMRGLDEFIVSKEKSIVAADLDRACLRNDLKVFEENGIRHPENQVELLARAVFLTVSYGGNFEPFVNYLATEFVRLEENADLQPNVSNEGCANGFRVLDVRTHVWTAGQRMYRRYPVGICVEDKSLWLFKEELGWIKSGPYERAEVCTTLRLQALDDSGLCSRTYSDTTGG